jgi:putative ABC transport system substrate-binding protein
VGTASRFDGLNRRAFVGRLAAATAAWLATACAGPFIPTTERRRLPLVAYATLNDPADDPVIASFRDGLRSVGYVEGQNVTLELRSAGGHPERYPAVASEVVDLRPDVICTSLAALAVALRDATSSVPLVVVNVDLLTAGLVNDVAHPGANVTGVSNVTGNLDAKKLQLLKEIVPSLTRVAAFHNPSAPAQPARLSELQKAADAIGVRVQPIEVRSADDVPAALTAATTANADALLILATAVVASRTPQIVEYARTHKLLTAGLNVPAGGLFDYGPDVAAQWRLGATYVARILKGASPGDLPVSGPDRLSLTINLKTARDLGLTIPSSVLAQATELIQ